MTDRIYQNLLDGLLAAARRLAAEGSETASIYDSWNSTVDVLETAYPGFRAWLGNRVVEF